MEAYIQISKISDFLYSPKSLYLHGVYESFNQKTYHETPQVVGKIKHKNIESGKYSTARRYLQGTPVFSERYNIGGKIDIYDIKTKTLIERKTLIKKIYDGHRFQLYAQMFCLEEVGYSVKKLQIQSLEDNKRYDIPLPDESEKRRFEELLKEMRHYDASQDDPSGYRCDLSIYRHLSY